MALRVRFSSAQMAVSGSAIQTQCLSVAKAIVEDVNSTKNLHKGLWDRRRTGVKSVFMGVNWVINSSTHFAKLILFWVCAVFYHGCF